MPRYQVFLETSAKALAEGGYLAHVPELPGCAARGKTKEEAIAGIRAAIRCCQDAAESFELDILETEAMIFPPDRLFLGETYLENGVVRAAASRQKLLDTLAAMPAEALDWREDQESWAIQNIVAHLAGADLWYASRLQEGGLPELLWRLNTTRALLLKQLDELPAARRDALTCHSGEEWTPRKVLRRMLEHEQEHLDQIQQLLTRYEKKSSS